MITKILFSGATVLAVSIGIAVPSGADPSVFSDLSCSCPQTVSNGGSSVIDQIKRGIQAGVTGIDAVEAQE